MNYIFQKATILTIFLVCISCNNVENEPTGGLATRPSNSTCIASPSPTQGTSISLEQRFVNLSFELPVALVQAPGDDSMWYVVEQDGKIIKFENKDDVETQEVFLDLSDKVLGPEEAGHWEVGHLGIAFHPDYENNGYVYTVYSALPPVGETCPPLNLSRFTLDGNTGNLDPASEEIILQIEPACYSHNAGTIAFGPDGYLYWSVGDRSNEANSQDVNTLPGSLLRIDVDGGSPYAIPADNPFAGGGGRPEIFAYGFRNPWKWSFDKQTGDIWLGDVGNSTWEEVNKVEVGKNYGWPLFEGLWCRSGSCDLTGLSPPVDFYPTNTGCAVTGGYVYRGEKLSLLHGVYLFGDFCTGNIWGLFPEGLGKYSRTLLKVSELFISSFAEDNHKELFIVDREGGIYQISEFNQGVSEENFNLLSTTGCFSPEDPTQPAEGLIPYDVNVPLWSDGAEKQRWMAIPDGKFIHINDDGKWVFPVKTVLVKNFLFQEKIIETRLLIQHQEDQWAGYSFEWNVEQTEAFLVNPTGKTETLSNGQQWRYPAQSQCLRCHTQAAGRVLGLETVQMNRLFHYPGTDVAVNQLAALNDIGLFSDILNAPPEDFQKFPQLEGEIPMPGLVQESARAYLHANCSICHRDGGPGIGPPDFQYIFGIEDMNICNVDPTVGNLGIDGAKLLFPGSRKKSIIYQRMKALDENRMPPLASHIVDDFGTELVGLWIDSLESCPESN